MFSCLPSGEDAEFLDSGFEFASDEGFHAVGGKGLAGEGGEDGAVDDGLTKDLSVVGRMALGGEITRHSAEEGIACSGGVGDGLKRVGGAAEDVRG